MKIFNKKITLELTYEIACAIFIAALLYVTVFATLAFGVA